ncbi:murein biosynthesis integral membrane protein MurJ, partial [Streptomyces lydicus]
MNAPYDGDRGRGANGDPTGPVPATPQFPADQDPFLQDAYRHDPHRAQDPTAQDPVTEARYDRAAQPPPGHAAPPQYQQQ